MRFGVVGGSGVGDQDHRGGPIGGERGFDADVDQRDQRRGGRCAAVPGQVPVFVEGGHLGAHPRGEFTDVGDHDVQRLPVWGSWS